MINSDDIADPIMSCPACGWKGHRSQSADDSPPGAAQTYVCLLCGGDLVTEPPPSSLHTPAEIALMKAALHTASYPNPKFGDEIDLRLSRAKRAVKFLAGFFSAAEFHQLDVDAGGLYGLVDLIANELETVHILVELRGSSESAPPDQT